LVEKVQKPFYLVPIILNLIALGITIAWLYFDYGFEPAVTCICLILSLCGIFIRIKNIRGIILFVDDEISNKHQLYKQIQNTFSDYAKVRIISDPKEACKLLQKNRNIKGCITELVFRTYSPIGGVAVAEEAVRRGIPVVVVTGYKRNENPVAYGELGRIGVEDERILIKPSTIDEYRSFLGCIKGWIIGF
jgi:hypothetical protein